MYMSAIQFYDSKNLAGRILIWVHNEKYETFSVIYTNPGLTSMSVSGYPLFGYRQNDYFSRQIVIYLKFMFLKRSIKKCLLQKYTTNMIYKTKL